MGVTANKGLYLLAENQYGAEVTFNESMYKLDSLIHLSPLAQQNAPGTETHGNVYLVDTAGTGDWEGYDNYIAYYLNNQWKFIPPKDGMRAYMQDTDEYVYYNGTIWTDLYGSSDGLSGHIVTPLAMDYTLILYTTEAFTITKLSAIAGTGSCTLGLSVDEVAPETTLPVTTSIAHLVDFDSDVGTQTLAVPAEKKVELVVSSVTTCLDLQFTIAITKATL